MSSVALASFEQTLTALAKILDKAAAHCETRKIDPAVLLGMRLYPDMLPLTKQVQLTSDFAKNTIGRLTGEAPKFPDEEKTIPELKARVAKTLDYVKSVAPAQIDGAAEKEVAVAATDEFRQQSKIGKFGFPAFVEVEFGVAGWAASNIEHVNLDLLVAETVRLGNEIAAA